MSAMAERTWEYLLPTGERLETRFDPDTHTESVYLGQRLVSRSTGPKIGGHVVELMHGDAAGPFRGGSAAKVVFDAMGPKCEVTIDDHPIEPSEIPPVAQLKEKPPDAEIVRVGPDKRGGVIALVTIVLIGSIVVIGLWFAERERKLAEIGARSLDLSARTPNGLLRIHYSADFTPQVSASPDSVPPDSRSNVVVLRPRDTRRGGIVMITLPGPPDSLAALETSLATGAGEPWAEPGVEIAQARIGAAGCFGDKHAAALVRSVKMSNAHFRVWSCTFLRRSRGYRFVTWSTNDRDAQVYKRIVDATELL